MFLLPLPKQRVLPRSRQVAGIYSLSRKPSIPKPAQTTSTTLYMGHSCPYYRRYRFGYCGCYAVTSCCWSNMRVFSKIEFDLTIKQWGAKRTYRDPYIENQNPDLEIKSELNFKSLSALEVLRKLLDYLHDNDS